MELLLLIYLIGCFCTLCFFITTITQDWLNGCDVSLMDILGTLCVCLGSWCTFIVCLIGDWVGDVVVFKGRKSSDYD